MPPFRGAQALFGAEKGNAGELIAPAAPQEPYREQGEERQQADDVLGAEVARGQEALDGEEVPGTIRVAALRGGGGVVHYLRAR